MGKKAAPAASPVPPPEPPKEEPVAKVVEEVPEELEGDFIFQDGSTYRGQYLEKGGEVCLHGDGLLLSGPESECGDESFQGRFEQGSYKLGRYTSQNGAIYMGGFRKNLFHGMGEYAWPDGRVYRGTWKDGKMHGRGQYLNFAISANEGASDKPFLGFSFEGKFASGPQDQEEAKKAFLTAYGGEYTTSARAALRDLAERSTAEGAPEEFLVPMHAPGEVEPPGATLERAAAEEVIFGPFPAANVASQAAFQAFVARLAEGAEQPLRVTVFEESGQQGRFDGRRLKRQQLQHGGQAVEFAADDAEEGAISLLVLVNICTEHDVAEAKWKLVHCEVAPAAAA